MNLSPSTSFFSLVDIRSFSFCFIFFCAILLSSQGFSAQESKVLPGVDVLFKDKKIAEWKGKRVGLITNQTGVDKQMRSTVDLLLDNAFDVKVVALFCPEH